jgi:hypothetical protein
MSKIFVDELAGIANANTVAIPGHVIQVVQGTTTTDTTVSATTYTDTTLTASITPSSTSSKILVVVSQSTYASRSAGSARIQFKLLRDSTSLQTFSYASSVVTGASSTEMGNIIALSYLDSPATTSSVTYKTQGRPSTTNNSEEARFQVSSSPSTITLMEIAG